MKENKYFIVEFTENFSEVKDVVVVYRTTSDFEKCLEFLISNKKFWELISVESEKFKYIEFLYKFKHNTSLKDCLEELRDIHLTLENNLDWIERELKE